ncbi:GHMP kinase family protein [Striga asiatica]|uniref:GHMP kinase family protein n=1 Tax=Striga asiatica TaxID=4170 RepID=A0A5A7QRF2_STRAF|nr:GHMP kinase family protein [Striga asiatica]
MIGSDGAVIEHRSYARVGLLGNPSDVYNGRTISFSLGNFWAQVRLEPSENLSILPHPALDLLQFDSLPHLLLTIEAFVFVWLCFWIMGFSNSFSAGVVSNDVDLNLWLIGYKLMVIMEGYVCSWQFVKFSTIIAMKMASDYIWGTLHWLTILTFPASCLLDFYQVRHLINVEVRPNLILNAEKELGIVAGLQDRVAQVYEGLVYMDFNKKHMEDFGHGEYIPMDEGLLPPLYLIYAENPSDSGKVHSTVRQRWLNGEKFIISSMEEVASIALEGRTALLEKDYTKYASLMNRNFDLRRQMFGDDSLGALNIKMVEIARRVGAASKFTGSGGAVVVFCP